MRPKCYILPDLPWLLLLDIIVRDAPPGSVIVVHTDEMQQRCVEAVQASGRVDLRVEHGQPLHHLLAGWSA